MSHPLEQQLIELAYFIKEGDRSNLQVSKKGTYWHLDHTIQILSGISELLKNSDPTDYKPKFSLTKLIIMNSGYIPRGKGRAPKHTLPLTNPTKEELLTRLDQAKMDSFNLGQLSSNKTFKHPLFGWLTKNETIKFMKIHTDHHLKIMRDIVK